MPRIHANIKPVSTFGSIEHTSEHLDPEEDGEHYRDCVFAFPTNLNITWSALSDRRRGELPNRSQKRYEADLHELMESWHARVTESWGSVWVTDNLRFMVGSPYTARVDLKADANPNYDVVDRLLQGVIPKISRTGKSTTLEVKEEAPSDLIPGDVEIEENPIGYIEAPIIKRYPLKIVGRREAIVHPTPVHESDEFSIVS